MARTKARRVFTKELKLEVLREIDAGATIAETARVHQVHPETIRLWRKTHRKYGEKSFAGNGRAYTTRRESRSSSGRSDR
jgi:transposase-like protein